jgi:hypothetical protein
MTNTNCLDALSISYALVTVDGTEYIVTVGTGEGTFAYLAEVITAESERYDAMPAMGRDTDTRHITGKDEYDYSEHFCSQCSPESDRDLAIALAARELIRIHAPGSCHLVLTQAEYDLVRATALVLDRC